MFKQFVSVTALVTAALSPSLAWGADDARSAIHISANIPTQQFHVQPRDPEFGKDEYMYYDPIKNTLSTLRQTYDVKNTDGSIHAYLPEDQPDLSNGAQAIPLRVLFNNVRLSAVPVEVVDDASSTPGTQAEMVIRPDAMPTNLQGGLYTVGFTVIFDAVPRVTP
ncbi:adhesin [Pseudomonas mediterranea]|uniref:CS1 type fimbrial major subunit n=1 Tax=Pseudomonas mediterranea TaxID=183795 RepID=A0AAX2D9E7_9PSED|nr:MULTISPECIES: CS1 type fimbrial major subunit [Pseudomonas]KGU85222.1 adhesin major subunit pilin [Pseudomonas mediterranea CFBP 5447]MBD0687485.1 adhesin [Pseudomonas sp. PSB18]MBL0843757.1 adhesin [Pseudomonas mediterranea]MDU9026875.1 CS1 type fimbrial major subunit [Pseudomonas mediterranea]QHA84277.1 adhesin [Pseudomonas mediterranea]